MLIRAYRYIKLNIYSKICTNLYPIKSVILLLEVHNAYTSIRMHQSSVVGMACEARRATVFEKAGLAPAGRESGLRFFESHHAKRGGLFFHECGL